MSAGGSILVRGGTIVDGTGAPSYVGDVLVLDGLIAAVGVALIAPPGTPEIDAAGLVVTPGWVDIHSHYDGQVTWDDILAPSSSHGVTTVVTGNCGVGFAPVIPERRDWLIELMEGVEDIPGTALAEGIDWSWETFPEYLDALESRRWTMDVGTQIAHGPVRAYVMGDRGAANEPATPEDIEAMRAIVLEAVAAGALGFSTSRTIVHTALDGRPVPGTFAAEDELFGIGSALKELGTGIFELAPMGVTGEDIISPAKEVEWMSRLSATIGRPVTFALVQVDSAPDLWRELMDASLTAVEQGADLWPQVAGRSTGLLLGVQTTYPFFASIPAYRELRERGLSGDALIAALRTPEVHRAIIEWEPESEAVAKKLLRDAERTFVLGEPLDYEPTPDKSVAAIAHSSGRSVMEVVYNLTLADDGGGLLFRPALNYSNGSLEPVREMILHPRSVIGLSDGGAHCGYICDASIPTFMLTHWVRDRTRGERLPLELMVKKQTHDTARLYGLSDRGTVEVGMVGDLNVIDLEALRLQTPRYVADLPAGGGRLLQGAEGYVATIKSGVVTFTHGEDTGARPGRLLRSSR